MDGLIHAMAFYGSPLALILGAMGLYSLWQDGKIEKEIAREKALKKARKKEKKRLKKLALANSQTGSPSA